MIQFLFSNPQKITKKITRYYNDACLQHGNTVYSVGWFSKATQERRYRVFTQLVNFSGASILDVGAGLGDLYTYLIQKGVSVRYEGIDCSQEMLRLAKMNHPTLSFHHADLFSYAPAKKQAYCLASGTFNLKVADNYRYLEKAIARMYALSEKGVLLNLLSETSSKKVPKYKVFFYYDPIKVMAIAKRFSRHVQAVQNYLPNDFTVFISRGGK